MIMSVSKVIIMMIIIISLQFNLFNTKRFTCGEKKIYE